MSNIPIHSIQLNHPENTVCSDSQSEPAPTSTPLTHSLKMDGIPTENTFFCCIHVVYSYPCIDVPYTHKCLIQSRHLAALGGRRVWAMRVVSAHVARNGLITWVETVHANQLHSSSLLGIVCTRASSCCLWVMSQSVSYQVQPTNCTRVSSCCLWVMSQRVSYQVQPTNNQEHATKLVLRR